MVQTVSIGRILRRQVIVLEDSINSGFQIDRRIDSVDEVKHDFIGQALRAQAYKKASRSLEDRPQIVNFKSQIN